jgi:carboxyl-terminal processing protease
MPDLFVPLDTMKYTQYHRNLVGKGVLNKFILQYMEKNRDELNKKYKADKNLFGKFKEEFEVSENDLKELIEAGEKEGVKLDSIQYGKSKNLIKNRLRRISRAICGSRANTSRS